jgi:S1-C subfamily serine protease
MFRPRKESDEVDATNSNSGASLVALSNDLAAAAERGSRFTVAVNARQRIPSAGVIWRPGIVVTAAHSIKREHDVHVTLPDGSTVGAKVAGRDDGTDIAVLKLDDGGGVPAETSEASALKVGHFVLALARDGDGDLNASFGAVSALSGPWRTWRGGQIDRFVRLDLTLYPGFSGGPLVDAHGRVAGINTSGLARNASLTIPASSVNRIARELIEKGRVPRGYLGVGMQPVALTGALRTSLNTAAKTAVIVLSIAPGSPAETAGLMIGDVVVALDGSPVTAIEDIQAVLGADRIGSTLPATVVRGGRIENVSITVGEWPDEVR